MSKQWLEPNVFHFERCPDNQNFVSKCGAQGSIRRNYMDLTGATLVFAVTRFTSFLTLFTVCILINAPNVFSLTLQKQWYCIALEKWINLEIFVYSRRCISFLIFLYLSAVSLVMTSSQSTFFNIKLWYNILIATVQGVSHPNGSNSLDNSDIIFLFVIFDSLFSYILK